MGVEAGTAGRGKPVRIDAIVCDLDGTLLRSDGAISLPSINALDSARAAGVLVVCATARTPRAVQRIPGSEHFGLMVCANGAAIWNASTDDIVAETCFDGRELEERIRTLRGTHPKLAFAVLTSRRMFVEPRYLCDRRPRDRELIDDVCEIVSELDIVSVAVRHPDSEAELSIRSVESGFEAVGTVSRGAR